MLDYINQHLTKPSALTIFDISQFSAQFNSSRFRVFLLLDACYSKIKDASLTYYLAIAGRRIVRFIPLQKVLALPEIQTAL